MHDGCGTFQKCQSHRHALQTSGGLAFTLPHEILVAFTNATLPARGLVWGRWQSVTCCVQRYALCLRFRTRGATARQGTAGRFGGGSTEIRRSSRWLDVLGAPSSGVANTLDDGISLVRSVGSRGSTCRSILAVYREPDFGAAPRSDAPDRNDFDFLCRPRHSDTLSFGGFSACRENRRLEHSCDAAA